MAIHTLEDLREHLQLAIEIEHATIPPYLTALYSLKPGHNLEVAARLMSVFVEEMLHLALAANVLNAVGGEPVVDSPAFVPRYPASLPHSAGAFHIPLAGFSRHTLETFMRIEYPEGEDAAPEEEHYHTIGQFYRAIEDGLEQLCASLGEDTVFCGDPARQVTPALLDYTGGGRVIPVTDLASARAAIDEIEEQGEGLKHASIWDGDRDMFHPEREEVAHYFRFQEIALGRAYQRGDTPQSGPTGPAFDVEWDAVYPIIRNARAGNFAEGSPARLLIDDFNQQYSDLLRIMHRSFNGRPQDLLSSFPAMGGIAHAARALMETPAGDGIETLAPSFEYKPPVAEPAISAAGYRITIERGGPYVVSGGVPLVRKSIVYSEWGEPLTWRKDETIPTPETYRLCRCGQSANKPFCDGSHQRVGFEGTETASTEPRVTREQRIDGPPGDGPQFTMTDDRPLCADAGFCGNRLEKVWDLIDRTDDSQVRFQLMQMVERCPSGRLVYEIDGEVIEPDLPTQVAVTKDGPYWVTGGIPIALSDGRELEVRNRVTLCRCGQSANKPLCDSTHAFIGFTDG